MDHSEQTRLVCLSSTLKAGCYIAPLQAVHLFSTPQGKLEAMRLSLCLMKECTHHYACQLMEALPDNSLEILDELIKNSALKCDNGKAHDIVMRFVPRELRGEYKNRLTLLRETQRNEEYDF